MANPYTSGQSLDPFAEQLQRPAVAVPVEAPRPQPATQAQPQFFNPTPQQANFQQAYTPTMPGDVYSQNNQPYVPSQVPQQQAPAPQFQQQPQQYQPPQYQQPQQQQQFQQPQHQQPQQPPQGPPPAPELATSKFWTLKFYQQFFEVDTKDVLTRLGHTLFPLSPPDFLVHRNWHAASDQPGGAQSNAANAPLTQVLPDMYGPFWCCTTLWMLLGIVGNIMSKVSHDRQVAAADAANADLASKFTNAPGIAALTVAPVGDWTYDFSVALAACATIYAYTAGMSLLLWGMMRWKEVPVGLIDSIALYGYSTFIFILCAILCVIPQPDIQWLVCVAGGLWSSAYLLCNFWHLWKMCLSKNWFFGVVIIVFGAHMLLTMSFKFYFLNYKLSY